MISLHLHVNQIHFPFPTFSNAALMESLKEAVEEGLTRAVGVSNFSKQQVRIKPSYLEEGGFKFLNRVVLLQMEEADDLLSQYGIPLTSNQVQYRYGWVGIDYCLFDFKGLIMNYFAEM